jgi:hypothetical protein
VAVAAGPKSKNFFDESKKWKALRKQRGRWFCYLAKCDGFADLNILKEDAGSTDRVMDMMKDIVRAKFSPLSSPLCPPLSLSRSPLSSSPHSPRSEDVHTPNKSHEARKYFRTPSRSGDMTDTEESPRGSSSSKSLSTAYSSNLSSPSICSVESLSRFQKSMDSPPFESSFPQGLDWRNHQLAPLCDVVNVPPRFRSEVTKSSTPAYSQGTLGTVHLTPLITSPVSDRPTLDRPVPDRPAINRTDNYIAEEYKRLVPSSLFDTFQLCASDKIAVFSPTSLVSQADADGTESDDLYLEMRTSDTMLPGLEDSSPSSISEAGALLNCNLDFCDDSIFPAVDREESGNARTDWILDDLEKQLLCEFSQV